MAGTVIVPGTQIGWNRIAYASGPFERATYQNQILVPIVEDGERLLGSMVIRKHQRVTGAVLAQTSDGTGLTYVNPIGSPVTVTAVGYTVPIAWSENEETQVDANMDQESGAAGSASMAELIEAAVAANFQSGTQIITNPTLDAPTMRAATTKLGINTNGMGMVGSGKTIYGYFSINQLQYVTAIPEFNSAEARGDSENPYVKGFVSKANGIVFNYSSVVAQDGSGYHNAVFLAEALTVRWNNRSRIKRQDQELQNRWIAYANLGSAVVHDLRMVVIRTS